MSINVVDLLSQMSVAIPTIIVATCTLTSAVHGVFNITKDWANHLISWIIAVITAEGFVLCNGLDFGLGYWNYLVGALCGIIVGASSNGIYDWASVKALFDTITKLFTITKKTEE